ncbi:MAG: WhiB family transcriptional regulator [Acidimicrobiales bacterium]
MDDLYVVTGSQDWAATGLCKGNQDLFFAPLGERRTKRTKREELAKAYCDQCTALFACRSWARTNREHGFWGGESEEKRASLGYPPRSPSRRAVAEIGRSAVRDENMAV